MNPDELERGASTEAGPTQEIQEQEPITKNNIIISGNGSVYQFLEKLSADESKALFAQTQLHLQENIVLGKGSKGNVYLVQNNAGVFMAVKKMENPGLFINERIAQDLLVKNGVNVLPVVNTINVGKWEGEPTVYKIMPIANVGSGQDLLDHWDAFSHEEKNLLLRYLTQELVSDFADMQRLRILHRNFMPNKFLLNLTGDVPTLYLTDCSSVAMFNLENKMEFKVSDRLNLRYLPPEFLHAHRLEIPGLDNHFNINHLNESWRLGLTLLQFVDRDLAERYKKLAGELKDEKNYEEKLRRFSSLYQELERVLTEKQLPENIRLVISQALNPEWQKRLSLSAAVNLLGEERVEAADVKPLFEKMITLRFAQETEEKKQVASATSKNDPTFFTKMRHVMGFFRPASPPNAAEVKDENKPVKK